MSTPYPCPDLFSGSLISCPHSHSSHLASSLEVPSCVKLFGAFSHISSWPRMPFSILSTGQILPSRSLSLHLPWWSSHHTWRDHFPSVFPLYVILPSFKALWLERLCIASLLYIRWCPWGIRRNAFNWGLAQCLRHIHNSIIICRMNQCSLIPYKDFTLSGTERIENWGWDSR